MDGVTLEETMVYSAAGEIGNGGTVFVGTGLPMLAAYLAKATHAPDVTLLFESGIIDPRPSHLALGVGDFRLMRDASGIRGLHYVLGLLQRGVIDVGFLGAAEVDQYGNINSTIIGGDYKHPGKRLPGSGGANDIASMAKATVIMAQHKPERLVEKVHYITSPGVLGGGDERKKAGLVGGGPVMLITDMAVFRFDPQTKRAHLASIHSGVDPADVVANAGFAIELHDGIPRTPQPDAATVELLRSLDPDGVYLRGRAKKE